VSIPATVAVLQARTMSLAPRETKYDMSLTTRLRMNRVDFSLYGTFA
jgi:hypothetical protein